MSTAIFLPREDKIHAFKPSCFHYQSTISKYFPELYKYNTLNMQQLILQNLYEDQKMCNSVSAPKIWLRCDFPL